MSQTLDLLVLRKPPARNLSVIKYEGPRDHQGPEKTAHNVCAAFRNLKILQHRNFQYPHTIRTLIGT